MPMTIKDTALLRGWIQGVSWGALGSLYLHGAERAEVISTVRSLRIQLATKAKRLGLADQAQLWRKDRDYNASWQSRSLASLDRLSRAPDPLPKPTDALSLWFAPAVCERLGPSKCATVQELAVWINRRGGSWWQAVPNLGRQSAETVHAFYAEWGEPLGLSLDLSSRLSSGPLQIVSGGIAPLERFALPEHLDGATGSNRAPQSRCRIEACNDLQAILAWLSLWDSESATFRSYRKESERFLLWALIEKAKPLSSITTPDCAEYRRFLAGPSPTERWIGKPAKRWSADWRPFKGPLRPTSVRQSEVILNGMCEWLVGQRYLDSNPFAGLSTQGMVRRSGTDRIFPVDLWETLRAYAEYKGVSGELDDAHLADYRRTAFILEFAYGTGLRAHELAQAKVGDLRRVSSPKGEQWWLDVIGKGKRHREIPIPPRLLDAINGHLRERNVGRIGYASMDTALIGKLRGDKAAGLTPSAIYQTLKRYFQEVADEVGRSDPVAADRLVRASTHWLRHSHGSHAVDAGVPLAIVRDNLGHATIATTSIYVHTDRDERYRAMANLAGDESTKEK